jgi:hypothetical protein
MSDVLPISENLPEQKCPSNQDSWNQRELPQLQTEIDRLLGQNQLVKKDLARQLFAAGLSMEVIGRILNIRVTIIKEYHSK